MMIFFILFTVVIALLLQKHAIEKGFDALEGDHAPDKHLVEVEESVSIIITLRNLSRSIILFVKVKARFGDEFRVDGTAVFVSEDYRGMQNAEFTAWLHPRQELRRRIPVAMSKRGRYVLNEMILQCGDFLGLQEQTKLCGRFNEIVVAPKEIAMTQFDDVLGGFLGDVSARRFIFADPILTLGYSDYTGREPMKMISWTQSARRNTLLVKKSDYTLEPTVTVILNVDTDLQQKEEVLEACFSMARSVCTMLENRNLRYGFVSNARLAGGGSNQTSSEEGMGIHHYAGILEHLGRATYEYHMPMEHLLEQEVRRQTSAGRILITPGGNEMKTDRIDRLREAAGGNMLLLCGKEAML